MSAQTLKNLTLDSSRKVANECIIEVLRFLFLFNFVDNNFIGLNSVLMIVKLASFCLIRKLVMAIRNRGQTATIKSNARVSKLSVFKQIPKS